MKTVYAEYVNDYQNNPKAYGCVYFDPQQTWEQMDLKYELK